MDSSSLTNLEKTAIRYGLIIAGVLTFFFVVMKMTGLAGNYQLRALNFPILAIGIIYAIKHFRAISEDFSYFKELERAFSPLV